MEVFLFDPINITLFVNIILGVTQMIHFKLKEPKDIAVFGSADKGYYLPWFACTDSYYCFDIMGKELLRYSDEYVIKHRMNKSSPYVDYYLIRLVEDLGVILPSILTPIPDDIFYFIQSPFEMENLNQLCLRWYAEQDDYPLFSANGWLYDRQLDCGYLRGAPRLYFFHKDTDIIIRWICDYEEEGTNMWKEKSGEAILSFIDFIQAIEDFLMRFRSQMDSHLDDILQNYARPSVKVEPDLLLREHSQRKSQIHQLLILLKTNQPSSIVNWSAIKQEISKVRG